MNKLGHLVLGEIQRLFKYNIIIFGIITSFLWAIIIFFADKPTVEGIAPFLVIMDAGLMSILLLGASYYLEKQERTLQSVIVTPVSLSMVLISKVVAAIFTAFVSFIIVVGSILIFQDIQISIFLLILYVILAVLAHTAVGYVVILYSNDFIQMLVRFMLLMLVFISPILLIALDLIPSNLEFLTYISPTYAAQLLFKSTYIAQDNLFIWISLLDLVILPAVLFPLVVYKRFEKVAVEG
jgi:ABC-type multidrug transport system permease subunit